MTSLAGPDSKAVQPMKTSQALKKARAVTEKVGPVGLQGIPAVPILGLTDMKID